MEFGVDHQNAVNAMSPARSLDQTPKPTQSAVDITMKKMCKAFSDTDPSQSRALERPQRAVPGLGPQGQEKQEDKEGRAEHQEVEDHFLL